MSKRLISLHPKLAALIEGVVTLLLLWWLKSPTSFVLLGSWFAVRLGWWIILVQLTYYPPFMGRWRHLVALGLSNIGALAFLVFGDASTMYYIWALTVGLSVFSFWIIPSRADELSVMEKPHRRAKLFLSLFGIAGIWLTTEACIAFQLVTNWQILETIIGAALVTAVVSLVQWYEYNGNWSAKYVLLAGLISLLLIELATVLLLWPVGYIVTAFLISWWWYILSLMIRFYLSRDGINWPRQRNFLILNSLIMIIFLLFIVRWK
jgi:hypothetical protein